MEVLNQAEVVLRQSALEVVREGIAIAVPAGQKLTIMQGDIVRMHVAFNYRGIGITCTLRCSIGTRIAGVFFESVYGQDLNVVLAESSEFLPYTAFADIDTSGCSPSADYDIEAKISEYMAQTLVGIDNVIDVIGAPEFQNFGITSYEVV